MKYNKINQLQNILKRGINYIRNCKGQANLKEYKKMSLGDSGISWNGFVTTGLSGQIKLDITNELPRWMVGHYTFIWSERMLEHISVTDLPRAFENISNLLEKGAKCRMSLPICFYGNQKINMVREGNEYNCKRQGHITWFTHEGFGAVTDDCFGAKEPPIHLITSWKDILNNYGLIYKPIRYYKPNNELYCDEFILTNQAPLIFKDEPRIIGNRYDSFIFDLIKEK